MTDAEAAVDLAAGYASDAVSQGNVPIYATTLGMTALSVPVGINALRVNGYAAAGDGGAAIYSDTDNGAEGQVEEIGGRTFYISNKKLTPRMYGAKSNGLDSLAAFTAWAADVSAGIGWGSIDRETYHVSDEIDLTGQDVNIEMLGVLVQTGTAKATFHADGVAGLRLMGGFFEGKGTEFNGGSTSYNGVAAVRCDSCTDVLISGLRGENHAGGFIVFTEMGRNVVVELCKSVGMGAAIISALDNGSDCGIQARDSGVGFDEFMYRGNTIRDHAFGVFLGVGERGRLLDNVISDIPGQHGFYIAGQNSFICRGNQIRNVALHGIKSQIGAAADVDGICLVDGNTVHSAGSWGVVVEAASPYDALQRHRNMIVSNNHVRACGKAGGGGFGFTQVGGLKAFNNSSRDSMGYGMYLKDCSGEVDGFHSMGSQYSGYCSNTPLGRTIAKRLTILNACLNTMGGSNERHIYPIYFASPSVATVMDLDEVRIAYAPGTDWKPWVSGETAEVDDWITNSSGLVYRCVTAGPSTVANEPVHTTIGGEVTGADGYEWSLMMDGEPATLQKALRSATNNTISIERLINETSKELQIAAQRYLPTFNEWRSNTLPVTGVYAKPFRVMKIVQAASASPGWELTTAGGAHTAAWLTAQTYVAGAWYRNAAGRVYELLTAGEGTTADEPVHTSGIVTGGDGYEWLHRAATAARWSPIAVLGSEVALP